jgi:hypothetical protein
MVGLGFEDGNVGLDQPKWTYECRQTQQLNPFWEKPSHKMGTVFVLVKSITILIKDFVIF